MSGFLFSIGPLDAGSSATLPRRPIPTEIIQPLIDTLPHVTFSSNPTRLRCYTQEIVICREDLLKKMQRHLVVPLQKMTPKPSTSSSSSSLAIHAHQGLDNTEEAEEAEEEKAADITEILVESILDQAHLSPLPLHTRPIHWELDYVMRLFPLPHLVRKNKTTSNFVIIHNCFCL